MMKTEIEDDSDSAMWKAIRKDKQNQRRASEDRAEQILTDAGIKFEKLTPHHWRIGDWDFWPASGKSWNRKTQKRGPRYWGFLRHIQALAKSSSPQSAQSSEGDV